VLGAAIEFITPAFVDPKERCVYFQGATAGMVCAFDFETVAVVDAAGNVEDHGVVEEVGGSEAKAVVAMGLGEMRILLAIVGMQRIVSDFQIERLFYFTEEE